MLNRRSINDVEKKGFLYLCQFSWTKIIYIYIYVLKQVQPREREREMGC